MQIVRRTFVWNDGRPDESDELRAATIEHRVQRKGATFALRSWDIRYAPGMPRVTEVVYDEVER